MKVSIELTEVEDIYVPTEPGYYFNKKTGVSVVPRVGFGCIYVMDYVDFIELSKPKPEQSNGISESLLLKTLAIVTGNSDNLKINEE